jgi:UDPglucose--hexose-1-phosphate uridylyltransferase
MEYTKNHFRQNILTEQWVIYAPERAKRPQHPEKNNSKATENLPEKDALCPFCIGNEKMVPEIIYELKDSKNDRWFTRVVPNKYPALTTEEDIMGGKKGLYFTTSAFGRHEVIIESPFHNKDIPLMSTEQVERVLDTYIERYRFLSSDIKNILNIIIFRNHGPASGTSLVHPHSQIIGTAIIPKYIHDKEVIAKSYFEKKGICSLCDIIKFEIQEGSRNIYENESFLAFVPFAAEESFEIWIAPKRHSADFGEINKREKADLAQVLRDILSVLRNGLNNPDYNYITHSGSLQKRSTPYLHWYLQIRPRTTIPAGFEIGSGVHINTSLPEDDAKILKDLINSGDELEPNTTPNAKYAGAPRF